MYTFSRFARGGFSLAIATLALNVSAQVAQPAIDCKALLRMVDQAAKGPGFEGAVDRLPAAGRSVQLRDSAPFKSCTLSKSERSGHYAARCLLAAKDDLSGKPAQIVTKADRDALDRRYSSITEPISLCLGIENGASKGPKSTDPSEEQSTHYLADWEQDTTTKPTQVVSLVAHFMIPNVGAQVSQGRNQFHAYLVIEKR